MTETAQERISWAQPDFWGNEEELVCSALRSTWISGGPYVERLEAEFAAYVGVPYALAVSNGTTAIHLAYLALGIGPGDEVIVPGFGFMAAANLCLHVGVTPVFAEVDPDTWCLDPVDTARRVTGRTKAIVPIHTYGNVCDMDGLREAADMRGIPIIEDAAEAFTSRYRSREAGSMSAIGTYSFQATKTITTGEGGMVVTHDAALYDRMVLYRSHGMSRTRYWHEVAGHNFRLTNLQAALGCAQMERLETIKRERRRVHAQYSTNLADAQGVRMQEFRAEVDPVLWAMAVRLDGSAFPQGRDRVIEQLMEAGIETRPGFYAASQIPLYNCPRLPACEAVASSVISLPTFPSLREEQIERICNSLLGLRS